MNLLNLIASSFLLCGVATAAAEFTLLPSPALVGSLGQPIPIQFTLTADNDFWINVISVFPQGETNPGLGVFEDLTYTQGGPGGIIISVNGPSFTGDLGTYTIDPVSPIGVMNEGIFWLVYETYTDNPLTCGNCLNSSNFALADFSVTVAAEPVPEPATLAMGAGGLALMALFRRRR